MEHTHHGPPSDQPEHTGAESEAHAHHPDHEHETGAMTGMEHGGHEMPPSGEMAHAGHTPDPHAQPMGHEMPPPAVASGAAHQGHDAGQHDAGQAGHGGHVDHTGHEQLFRRRFWVSLLLSVPVLVYSPMLQMWLGFTAPDFPGSDWVGPAFAVIIFLYGGVPFLQMAVPELRERKPGMMMLISLAISVALAYSLAALFLPGQEGFFWELVTLIDIMLLGHWLEMRSVRQASGALAGAGQADARYRRAHPAETAALETVAVSALRSGDLVLVRPGASIPADGTVESGESQANQAMITGESRPVSKRPGDGVIAGTINGDGSLRVRVGHRRPDRAGRHHAPGGAGPADQVPHPGAGRPRRRAALLRGASASPPSPPWPGSSPRAGTWRSWPGWPPCWSSPAPTPWAWPCPWWWPSPPPWRPPAAC